MNLDHYINRKSDQHPVIHEHMMGGGVFSVMAKCQRPDGKGTSWYGVWSKHSDVDGCFFSDEKAETLARTIARFPEVLRTVVIKIGKHAEIVAQKR